MYATSILAWEQCIHSSNIPIYLTNVALVCRFELIGPPLLLRALWKFNIQDQRIHSVNYLWRNICMYSITMSKFHDSRSQVRIGE
jgi:hypothetical protein